MREKIEQLIEEYKSSLKYVGHSYYYGDNAEHAAYYDGQDSGKQDAYERIIEDLERLLKEIE